MSHRDPTRPTRRVLRTAGDEQDILLADIVGAEHASMPPAATLIEECADRRRHQPGSCGRAHVRRYRVVMCNGDVKELESRELFDNAGLEGLRIMPGHARGRECRFQDSCFSKSACRFIHVLPSSVEGEAPPPRAPVMVTCVLCCESRVEGGMYECRNRHAICRRCLSSYLLENWPRTCAMTAEVRCLAAGCDADAMSLRDIVRFSSDDALAVFVKMQRTTQEAALLQELHAKALAVVPDPTGSLERLFLAEAVRRTMREARQCPQCGCGPVDHHGCADLAQHHGQATGGAVFSNRCAACGFFAAALTEWPRWDGVVRVVEPRPEPGR